MGTEGAVVGGRYRLDQPIGRGRAGIVWLAYDTLLHRTVAAKRVFVQPGLDPARTEHMINLALQEGRAATRVLHNSAITVYDVVRDGPDPWLVMEYVPSRSMAHFLTEHGTLTPEQAAFLGIQLASALSAAHRAGILHRGLEPGNVLLADDGGVKITDIGITGPGQNPAFRAPEILHGAPPDHAADAFSLGATLYQAVEGVPPYGENGTGPLRQPRRAGQLTGALMKLLRVDPMTRPTLADSIIAFQAITQGRQSAFIPPTAPALPTIPVAWPVGQPLPQPVATKAPLIQLTPARVRALILTVLAVLCAAAIGVGITQVLFL
ncbi:serine/threonine protein kinase [Amycolatopsis acidiphila]|uniref:non-specific serine/threonine protein kinase n=1 Tax=Amycolatopsis acidiphila TaxID=715473 RepID=A0A557ZYH8_9PSEU|nr:serine/threonine-protein kinase [Amycolatopsis acidiphila]TVT17057.1 serine/threonine protein kinase [Amycolatopsis acidiphila]UIJ60776.1 serine/threonine protein kinase [Amycolatopsis acidiphila]GHG90910.1 serine/threonine protein kinase [Amycolatopsis acidiphila]